jgi:hypothetical protein
MKIKGEGIYQGNFVDGMYQGFGVFDWDNGNRYEGEWKMNLMDGKGVMTYKNKDEYEGDFCEGMKDGYGKFTDARSLMVYKGPWKYGKQHGVGNLCTKEGQNKKALYGDGKLVHWIENEDQPSLDDVSSML